MRAPGFGGSLGGGVGPQESLAIGVLRLLEYTLAVCGEANNFDDTVSGREMPVDESGLVKVSCR
jgi:hypothetical protein